MKTALAVIAGSVLCGSLALAQDSARPELPKNAPHFIKSDRQPGFVVRYLDFNWDETALAAMETGGDHPAARRSWVLARILVQNPVRWNGRTIPVGPFLLILNPARKGGAGATLELRKIDMREVFVDLNVIAEPPEGETYGRVPAVFARVDGMSPRLAVSLQPQDKAMDVVVHYGDREAVLTLART